MTPTWIEYTLTGAGVNLATILGITQGTPAAAYTKIRMQLNPASTGPYFKVQGTTAAYASTGPGILRGIGPTNEYLLEDQNNADGIRVDEYYICGANAGDKLELELHQA